MPPRPIEVQDFGDALYDLIVRAGSTVPDEEVLAELEVATAVYRKRVLFRLDGYSGAALKRRMREWATTSLAALGEQIDD